MRTSLPLSLLASLLILAALVVSLGEAPPPNSAPPRPEPENAVSKDQEKRTQDEDAMAKAIKAKAIAEQAAHATPTRFAKIKSAPGVEFERAYFTMEAPMALRTPVTIEIWGDGTCKYLRVENNDGQLHIITERKLTPDRVKRLSELLAKTDWLTQKSTVPLIDDGEVYTAKVMRTLETGTPEAAKFDSGATAPYKDLGLFILGVLRQEELYEKVLAGNHEGLDELARYLSGQSAPAVEIDLAGFREEMVKVVRDPLDREDWQVAPALRAMAFYRASGERKWIESLATDRSGRVREAVAETLADFGGVESVAVLKNMMPRTEKAGFGLVRLGKEAVPAIAEIISQGKGPETDAPQVQMIRAYVDNWEKVPKPVDERVIAAVKESLAAARLRKDSSEMRYHETFLELVRQTDAKSGTR